MLFTNTKFYLLLIVATTAMATPLLSNAINDLPPASEKSSNGFNGLSKKQMYALHFTLDALPEIFGNKNMLLVQETFTDDSSMVCSGKAFNGIENVARHLKDDTMIREFTITSASPFGEMSAKTFGVQGSYLWNGFATRQFFLIFEKDTDGFFRIAKSIIVGC